MHRVPLRVSSKGYGTLPRDLAKALAKRYRFVVKRLDLSQNQLLSVPRCATLPPLARWPDGPAHSHSHSRFAAVPCVDCGRELSSLRNVKNLSLADNLLSDVDGGVLAKLSSLETLDVRCVAAADARRAPSHM